MPKPGEVCLNLIKHKLPALAEHNRDWMLLAFQKQHARNFCPRRSFNQYR